MSETIERIEKIRGLLAELEGELRTSDDRAFVKNFDALEVPQLVAEVVRYLQPLLTRTKRRCIGTCSSAPFFDPVTSIAGSAPAAS